MSLGTLGSLVPVPGVSKSIPAAGEWEHRLDEVGWEARVKHSLNKQELGKKGFSLKNKEIGGSQGGQSCHGIQEAPAQVISARWDGEQEGSERLQLS